MDKPSLFWLPGALEETKRNLMRKAQFGFGWDWGPRLPTIGIWRPVEIRRERQATIKGVYFATLKIDPTEGQALVSIKVDIERFAGDQPIEVTLVLILPDEVDAIVEQTLALTERGSQLVAEATISVDQPSLW